MGWLILAALLPDFLLGWFALGGWESYAPPAGYESKHYLLFTFPWSHGLAAGLIWAATGAFLAFLITRRRRCALGVAIAVLSHFVLDGIAQVKGLPLVLSGSPVFGLGLWRHLPFELALEAGMTVAGLWIYLNTTREHLQRTGTGMAIYTAVLAVFLVIGQWRAAGLPSRAALITSWLMAPPIMAGIALWFDRRPRSGRRGLAARVVLEGMILRIRFGRGMKVSKVRGKNRRIALMIASVLTPFSLMAAVLGLWRLGSDLSWVGEFAIPSGPLSHWQVWLSAAAGIETCSLALGRYGRGEDSAAE
ncbi:MAG: hypothetical protein EXQ52_05295 [Bryobacterales bacterium]|nr:hypothetical protein [Bryobacterales bacterium]